MAAYESEEIEQRRDRTLRRLPALRVAGPRRAMQFLDDAGLASLFAYRQLHLPCLWVAVCGRRDPHFPVHSHGDPELALAWRLKDALPAAGRVFYAKLLRGKPTFVSWELFPAVYRLFGPRTDDRTAYRVGLLSPAARAILDALHRRRLQETPALKRATNLAQASQRRVFDSAMAELQQTLRVCMVEARYDPGFTYVWDLVEARHAAPVRAARRWRRWRAPGSSMPRRASPAAPVAGSSGAEARGRDADPSVSRRRRGQRRSSSVSACVRRDDWPHSLP